MEDLILFANPKPKKSMKPKKPTKVVRDRKTHENRGTWYDTFFTEDPFCDGCDFDEQAHKVCHIVRARCRWGHFVGNRGPMHW